VCPHAQVPDHKAIRYVVAHEVTLLRQGLRRLLEDEPDLEIVAEAENAAQALRHILEQRPNVVIADPALFGCSPPEAEQMILRESPETRVVFLPSASSDERWPGALHHSKCAARQTSAQEFVAMVRGSAASAALVMSGGDVSEFPVDDMASRKRVLTAREQEVLKLLAEGRTVRSVAGILGLSVKTVDAHKFNLMRKLGIHNKAELVIWAIQKKVVKLPVNF
jgi:two-component system, NarL family, response regulator NreC